MIATKVIKLTGTLTLALACIGAQTSLADNTPDKNSVQTALSAAPAAELPAVAARMVSKAKARERESTTHKVVQAALAINPAAAPAIVGAIARAVPEMAHTAAGYAAAQEPKQADAIARAAAAAAPSRAGKIVVAVCSAVPNQYRSIALAVAEVAPTSSKDILKSVALAVPALKPYIDKEIAGYGLSLPSVATTLDQARIAQARPSSGLAIASGTPPMAPSDNGGVNGAPQVPGSSTPANTPPPTGGGAPPSGRNYARP